MTRYTNEQLKEIATNALQLRKDHVGIYIPRLIALMQRTGASQQYVEKRIQEMADWKPEGG